jgi:hypothetical protein
LEQRFVANTDVSEVFSKQINYDDIDARFASLISESKKYLLDALESQS